MSTYYQEVITDQLMKVESLQNTLKMLACRDNFSGYEKELLDTVTLEEKLCLDMRQLIRTCGVIPISEYGKYTQNLLGITVKKKGSCVLVTLPPLRPREKYSECTAYIILPLFEALLDFSEEEHSDVYEKARIVVCHCYDPDTPKNALPDIDNFELKNVLDMIATYFLVDDNITRCELLLTSKADVNPHTEITVIPLVPNE